MVRQKVKVGEKKDQFDDVLNVTCAAVKEGILPGGGESLLALASTAAGTASAPDAKLIPTANLDQDLGVSIIMRQ